MNQDEMYTPAQAAKRLGVSVKTIHRWDKAGKLKTVRTAGNQRRIPAQEVRRLLGLKPVFAPRCAVYARVSSQKQAKDGNLERQKQRLLEAAAEKGYQVVAVIAEQASGLNENRRGLHRLFALAARGEIDLVLVEFKDRLARFGFSYIERALGLAGARVEILEEDQTKSPVEELVEDMLSIVTVFSARLYGQRGSIFRRKVKDAMKEMAGLDGSGQKNNQNRTQP
jgi:excisionase family DNA binding protein